MPRDGVIRVVICGVTGRMGRLLCEQIAAAPDLRLAGGIARRSLAGEAAQAFGCPRVERPSSAGPLVEQADVLIDFSTPEALAELLHAQVETLDGRALVVGTTGLDAELTRALEQCATRAPVLVAANFSVGVNLLLELAEIAGRALNAPRYDVEIVETHHGRKMDAPSGTALALGEAVANGRGAVLRDVRRDGRSGRTGPRPPGEIGFHALRGGGVPGEHRVLFLGERERVELAHAAADRSLFAEGALTAARWLVGRAPGEYDMRQVLGIRSDGGLQGEAR